MLEGNKGRQNNNFNKMDPKWMPQNRIAILPRAFFGRDTSSFGPEAHGEVANSL